ncbi:MAG TPA: hypothetical protein DDX71_04855, partial [Ruminococcus sp.]|nr:hypothetical protein [Ruminococcus sp.]
MQHHAAEIRRYCTCLICGVNHRNSVCFRVVKGKCRCGIECLSCCERSCFRFRNIGRETVRQGDCTGKSTQTREIIVQSELHDGIAAGKALREFQRENRCGGGCGGRRGFRCRGLGGCGLGCGSLGCGGLGCGSLGCGSLGCCGLGCCGLGCGGL